MAASFLLVVPSVNHVQASKCTEVYTICQTFSVRRNARTDIAGWSPASTSAVRRPWSMQHGHRVQLPLASNLDFVDTSRKVFRCNQSLEAAVA